MEAVSPPATPVPPPPPKPFSWWLRQLFACNPFYLVSAALLLYGCYRLSVDTAWFTGETARLFASFTSVQFYEVLLVSTAIFLASRRLWYDSTLLVGLENLLVFVPFILISQAALTDSSMSIGVCIAAVVLAVLRFGGLKKFFHELNLPGRCLGLGAIILGLNVALPLMYRHFGETKIGVHIDRGPAYEFNQYTWLLILPAALALANFLPFAYGARPAGDRPHQHRWLPDGLFALWITATVMHVYCLDYIYQFDLRPDLIAPGLWVLGWTVWLNLPARTNRWLVAVKRTLEIAPLLVVLFACSQGIRPAFYCLAGLNVAAYLAICVCERENRVARHLLALAMLTLIAGLPEQWLRFMYPSLTQGACVEMGVAAYLVFGTALSRDPRLALLGSMLFGSGVASVLDGSTSGVHWAFQGALGFILLHSLRWDDPAYQGAKAFRTLAALMWVAESLLWMNAGGGKFWMPWIAGGVVLAVYVMVQLRRGHWTQPLIPAAAILVILSGPGNAFAQFVYAMPAGLMAVAGSFVLFGLGTGVALTRNYWHKPHTKGETDKLSPGARL